MTRNLSLVIRSRETSSAALNAGFTTLELILVLTLMGILGGMLLSHANLSFDTASETAALRDASRLIKARVAHVQNLAIRNQTSCEVRFFEDAMEDRCGVATDEIDTSMIGESRKNPSYGKDEKTNFPIEAKTFPILTINSNGVIEEITNSDGSREGVKKAIVELECGDATETVEIVAGVKQ